MLLSVAEAREQGSLPVDERMASLQTFLESHCIKCHGAKKAKGGIRLDRLDQRIALGFDFETWTAIHEQLREGQMPPEDERQPEDSERLAVVSWIGVELEKAQRSDRVRYLSGQFAFGNKVSHEDLFSGEIEEPAFSPPRLWRINPNIYDRTKHRILKHHWETLGRVRQPFALEKAHGFRDYASNLHADSATLETLLRNARTIVEHQLNRDIPEVFREVLKACLLYTSPSPRDRTRSRMPSSA